MSIILEKTGPSTVVPPSSLLSNHGKSANFIRITKWSPDGSILLTATEDAKIKLYPTVPPPVHKVESCNLTIPLPGSINDLSWYPWMNQHFSTSFNSASNPSCCFLAAVKDQPVHLWDAITGTIRASYISINKHHQDILVSPTAVSFAPSGGHFAMGGLKSGGGVGGSGIFLFDILRPGKITSDTGNIDTSSFIIHTSSSPVNSISWRQDDSQVLATGNTVGDITILDSRLSCLCPAPLSLLNTGKEENFYSDGVSQVSFSHSNGWYLYSRGRKRASKEILKWDLRNGKVIKRLRLQDYQSGSKKTDTNQRLFFDSCVISLMESGNEVILGGSNDGNLGLFLDSDDSQSDLDSPQIILPSCVSLNSDEMAIASISINPTSFLQRIPTIQFISAHGERGHSNIVKEIAINSSDDDSVSEEEQNSNNCDGYLQLWNATLQLNHGNLNEIKS